MVNKELFFSTSLIIYKSCIEKAATKISNTFNYIHVVVVVFLQFRIRSLLNTHISL